MITATIIALIWVAIGILIMEVGIRANPAWVNDLTYKFLVIGVVFLWPFSLAVVIFKRLFGKS